jgi:hypothetical protein
MEYKRCYKCKFFAKVDSGYSNYTVTETTIHCLKKHFEPCEESYSWKYTNDPEKDDAFFKYAENCPDYKAGDSIELDVDGDITIEDYKADDELYNAALAYGW